MEHIWAPWRKEYITMKKSKTCIFCRAGRKRTDERKNHVLQRTRYAFSILNRYPYNNGHVMIAPYRHVKSLELLRDNELLDLMKLVNETKVIIDRRLKPAGYNIGVNIGISAGAGYPGHVHVHIVPRWTGDTNFMPVVSDTKVLPRSLDEMRELLKC